MSQQTTLLRNHSYHRKRQEERQTHTHNVFNTPLQPWIFLTMCHPNDTCAVVWAWKLTAYFQERRSKLTCFCLVSDLCRSYKYFKVDRQARGRERQKWKQSREERTASCREVKRILLRFFVGVDGEVIKCSLPLCAALWGCWNSTSYLSSCRFLHFEQ